jgi:hypothetical protein
VSGTIFTMSGILAATAPMTVTLTMTATAVFAMSRSAGLAFILRTGAAMVAVWHRDIRWKHRHDVHFELSEPGVQTVRSNISLGIQSQHAILTDGAIMS